MGKRMVRARCRAGVSLFLLLGLLALFGGHSAASDMEHHDYSAQEIVDVIDGAIQWKKSMNGSGRDGELFNDYFLESAGTTAADWTAIAIGRSGYADDYQAYLAVLADKVSIAYEREGTYGDKKTDIQRIALTVLALGGDPTDIGQDEEGNPINLIADATYGCQARELNRQGANAWIYALLVLDSMGYEVPKGQSLDRESILERILAYQTESGGFCLTEGENGGAEDVDVTAMALQALSPYQDRPKAAAAVEKGLTYLSQVQTQEGGYVSYGAQNLESAAQVLIALTVLDIDPGNDSRFIKNGYTVLDAMMSYRMEDGGFCHSKEYSQDNPTADPKKSNDMASDQAMLALTSLARYYGGYRSFYDFREESQAQPRVSLFGSAVEIQANIRFTDEDEGEVLALPEEVTTEDYLKVVKLLDKYQKSINKQEYSQCLSRLQEKREKILELQEEIENINESVATWLYPLSDITWKDRAMVKEIQERVQALSPYDQTKILEYEDILQADAILRSLWIERIGTWAVGILAAVLLITVLWRIQRRRRKKREEDMEEEDAYEDRE